MAEILLVNPKRRKAKSAKRRRAPAKRRARRARKAVAVTVKANPKRRRRYAHRVGVSRRKYRRNPSFRGITGQIVPTIKAGFVGALGGLGLDVLSGYVSPKLPAQLQTGYGKTATKILGAVLVGMLGNMVMRGKGRDLAAGAMTVVLHDALKAQVASSFPGVPLGEYFSAGPVVGYGGEIAAPMQTGIGEYFNPLAGESYAEDDARAYGAGY